MEMILEFLRDVLSQPALLIGIMSCVGLIALKRPFHKIMTGTLKTNSRLFNACCWCRCYR